MKFDNNDFQTAVRLALMKHKKTRESENVTIHFNVQSTAV